MVRAVPVALLLLALLGAGSPPASGGALWSRLWECRLGGRGGARGTIVDLDGDGRPEVVVSRYHRETGGSVSVIDGRSGRILWSRAVDRAPAVVVDLDDDGAPEVVVVSGGGLDVLAGSDGGRVASVETRGVAGALAAGDLDGDGRPEILCATGIEADDTLVALSGTALDVAWRRRAAGGDGPFDDGFTRVACADVDGNGADEVLVVENRNRLVCMGADGSEIWAAELGEKSRLRPHGVVSSEPRLFALGESFRGVAVGCFAGALIVCDAETGEIIGRSLHGAEAHAARLGRRRLPLFIARALRETGEPVNEIRSLGETLVFGCSDGKLYAVRAADQSVSWSFDCEGTVYEPCVPVDVGAPGVRAILAWDERRVYLLDAASGSVIPSVSGPASGASAILVGDLDGIGDAEVVIVDVAGREVTAWSLR